MKTLFVLLITALFMFSCSEQEDILPTEDILAVEEVKTFEQLVLDIINERRVNGFQFEETIYSPVDSVKMNDKLTKGAKIHSDYMEQNQSMTYKWKDGTTIGKILGSIDYRYSFCVGVAVKYDPEDPHDLVNKFMGMQCNCDYILDARPKDFGIAKSGEYWCLIFAK